MHVGNYHRKYQMSFARRAIITIAILTLFAIQTVKSTKTGQTETSEKAVTASVPVQTTQANLTVYYMDVGQGDATLLVSGEDAVLIDAGRENQGTKIRKFLKDNEIDSLDAFVMTHPDADHIGGAASVISNVAIDTVYWNGMEKDTKTFSNMKNELFYHNITPVVPKAGDTFDFGTCQAEVLAPIRSHEDANDMSIVLQVTCGETKFLFTGDAEADEEGDMANVYGDRLKSDVYKVGHHGSSTASNEPFLSYVNPTYAVISCGKDNDYGHPHKEVMDKLQNTTVFRTDLQGDIILSSDGNTIHSN